MIFAVVLLSGFCLVLSGMAGAQSERTMQLESPLEMGFAGPEHQIFKGEPLNASKTLKGRILARAREHALAHEYAGGVYDCTEFTEELQRILASELGVKSRNLLNRVNCSCSCFDREGCEAFEGWHEFLLVFLEGQEFYIEAVSGQEIPETLYPCYGI